MIEERGLSVYKASRFLGIKNCTAKVILRQYRRKGHIFKRLSEKEELSGDKNRSETSHLKNDVKT